MHRRRARRSGRGDGDGERTGHRTTGGERRGDPERVGHVLARAHPDPGSAAAAVCPRHRIERATATAPRPARAQHRGAARRGRRKHLPRTSRGETARHTLIHTVPARTRAATRWARCTSLIRTAPCRCGPDPGRHRRLHEHPAQAVIGGAAVRHRRPCAPSSEQAVPPEGLRRRTSLRALEASRCLAAVVVSTGDDAAMSVSDPRSETPAGELSSRFPALTSATVSASSTDRSPAGRA